MHDLPTLFSQNAPGVHDVEINVIDEKGDGGAYHQYLVRSGKKDAQLIRFQKGPVNEAGLNGLTQEALLAIVEHRLECFQQGDFASDYNAEALGFVRYALSALHRRTQDRMNRNVEGTSRR